MEKACISSNWKKNVVASGIAYSLFDGYDQPKLSLAVSNDMTVTCGYYGWNAKEPPYGLPVQHQTVYATLLGLAAAKVCAGSQRNCGIAHFRTKCASQFEVGALSVVETLAKRY